VAKLLTRWQDVATTYWIWMDCCLGGGGLLAWIRLPFSRFLQDEAGRPPVVLDAQTQHFRSVHGVFMGYSNYIVHKYFFAGKSVAGLF
jgi:hypothetical protein